MKHLSPKIIGSLAREARITSGLTLDEASLVCNVGRRFLVDLEKGKDSLHLGMTLSVLERLGIRVSTFFQKLTEAKHVPQPIVARAPSFDDGNWVKLNLAIGQTSSVVLNGPWTWEADSSNNEVKCSFTSPCVHISTCDSTTGLFSYADETSSMPSADVDHVMRSIIFGLIIGIPMYYSELHRFYKDEFRSFLIIVPLSQNTQDVEKNKGEGAISLKGETNIEWMRADHFIQLAKDAHVRPEFVFKIMRSLAKEVPEQFRKSLEAVYKSTVFRGRAEETLRAIEARALRANDLVSSAAHQGVSGELIKPLISITSKKKSDSYTGNEPLYE